MDEKNYIIIIVACVGAITFCVLILLIVTSIARRKNIEAENKLIISEKERQIELFKAITNAEEAQKLKIAAQLHDEIIPKIIVASTKIYNHVERLESDGIKLNGLKRDIATLPALQDDLREIILDIVPAMFTSFGLLKAIEVFLKDLHANKKADAKFYNDTTFAGEPPFSKHHQLIIFKVCRELLNNLFNHSNYEYLTLSLVEVKENLTFLFSHNGKGITTKEINELKESNTGMGLKLLESRLMLLSASLDYYIESDVSYVLLKIPVTNEKRN